MKINIFQACLRHHISLGWVSREFDLICGRRKKETRRVNTLHIHWHSRSEEEEEKIFLRGTNTPNWLKQMSESCRFCGVRTPLSSAISRQSNFRWSDGILWAVKTSHTIFILPSFPPPPPPPPPPPSPTPTPTSFRKREMEGDLLTPAAPSNGSSKCGIF